MIVKLGPKLERDSVGFEIFEPLIKPVFGIQEYVHPIKAADPIVPVPKEQIFKSGPAFAMGFEFTIITSDAKPEQEPGVV